MKLTAALITVLLGVSQIQAATYYVDYDNGSNANNGTSESTPWKQAPGDPNASGNADITPSAGDVILLRGGVRYKGKLTIGASGTSGNPIVYKGDGWGSEKAIIDCSEEVTGWTKCTSAADCGGNSNWANIYYATVASPPFTQPTEVNLWQEDLMLGVAQYPNPADILFMGAKSGMLLYDSATRTAVTHDTLAALGSDLVGMHVYVYAATNQVYFKKIKTFNAGTNTIGFDAISKDPYDAYAIANGLNEIVFDQAGEVAYDEGTKRLYVWPLNGADPNTVTMRLSERGDVINLNGKSYVHFEGISGQRGLGRFMWGSDCTGVEMRDCEVKFFRSSEISNSISMTRATDCLYEDNLFNENVRLRSILVTHDGENIKINNNRAIRVGRSPFGFWSCDNSEMVGNYVEDCRGVHSNGLTVYGLGSNKSSTILVKNNIVINSNVALTFQITEDLTIVNNLFDAGSKGWSMACWGTGSTERVTILHNSLVNSGSARSGFFALPEGSASLPNSVIKNNIIDGMANYGSDISHNLYTMLAIGQVNGQTGDVINLNKDLIFTDWANGDWTLKAGSPAIDAGTDVGISEDINGVARTVGSAPDKGCYEYDPSAIGDELTDDGLALGGLVIPNPVRAMAGAVIVNRAVLEYGADAVGLFTMAGRRVTDLSSLDTGFYLLQAGDGMRRIMIVD